MNKLIVVLFLLSLLVSCNKKSSKLDQEKIFQRLEMKYDADENVTTFSAQFSRKRESGRLLKLDGNSSITLNGQPMEFLGAGYSLKFDGIIDTGVFVYTNNEGEVFTNTVTAVDEISNGYLYYIYKSNSTNTWSFLGDPIYFGEEVTIQLVNQSDLSSSSKSTSSEIGSNAVTITSSDLESLVAGYANATTIRRNINEAGNFTSAGGVIISSYYSFTTVVSVQ